MKNMTKCNCGVSKYGAGNHLEDCPEYVSPVGERAGYYSVMVPHPRYGQVKLTLSDYGDGIRFELDDCQEWIQIAKSELRRYIKI